MFSGSINVNFLIRGLKGSLLSQRRYVGVDAAEALRRPAQPPHLVGRGRRGRRARAVAHRPHLLPRPVLSGALPSPAPRRGLPEPTDVRPGILCAPLQPLVGRLVAAETLGSIVSKSHSTITRCCFPDDPVYLPLEVQREEYIKSDYGLVYMGSHQNISRRPWLYGQVGP